MALSAPLAERQEPPAEEPFDYIVVGAGSSGCALVGRLAAALPFCRIALVEPGEDVAQSKSVANPQDWAKTLSGNCNHGYETEQQKGLGQRWLPYPVGRGLGGTSLINAMIYSRGYREDWDKMPAGWHSEDVAPAFEEIEARLRLTSGTPGPFGCAAAAAAESLGFPKAADDGWEHHGVIGRPRSVVDATTGRRVDVYRAMGADRDNVRRVRGRVARVHLRDVGGERRADAVELLAPAGTLRLRPGGEVVLCAGAVETPKLLQISGIGPAGRVPVPLVHELPVGYGLKDHTLLSLPGVCTLATDPLKDFTPNGVEGFVNDEASGAQLMLMDGAPMHGMLPFIIGGLMQRPGLLGQLLRPLLRYVLAPLVRLFAFLPFIKWLLSKAVGINVCLVRTSSTGTVFARSADPRAPPAIDPGLLSSEDDMERMVQGVKLGLRLFSTDPLRRGCWLANSPGRGDLEKWIRAECSCYWHATGTCAMGRCLDPELRVLGIKGLRVADASVLPLHPRAPPFGTIMVVGYRCADLLVAERATSLPRSMI